MCSLGNVFGFGDVLEAIPASVFKYSVIFVVVMAMLEIYIGNN
jgi:hypothetical protein